MTVTLPVPEGFSPTQVDHISDDGTQVYESFLPTGATAFAYDEASGTMSFVISHCSHLITHFEAKTSTSSQGGALPAAGDNTAATALAIALAAIAALAVAAMARKRIKG